MKKFSKLFLASILTVSALTGCSSSNETTSSDKPVLVMGTSADYKPFEYIDTAVSEDIIGFDVDMARYIANELGYELEIQDMDFNSLITAVKTDKVDIVVAGMTPTEERKESVDFSDVYYSAKNVILTTNDNEFTSEEDLSGLTLGAQTGSIQETLALSLKDAGTITEVQSMNRIPELVEEMKSGRIDAIIIENMIVPNYLEKNENFVMYDIFSEEAEKGSAIALKQGSELTAQINEVIAQMKENGEMDKLAETWFND